jgi:hypothetical protein
MMMMKSMYFESQYLYDMSRLFYLRSILRNCWLCNFCDESDEAECAL